MADLFGLGIALVLALIGERLGAPTPIAVVIGVGTGAQIAARLEGHNWLWPWRKDQRA